MDIETFVRDSLVGLATGIREANAAMNSESEQKRTYFVMWDSHAKASLVDFDIAVTASKEGSVGTGAKINVVVADVDIGGKGKIAREDVSRVKFAVKVEFGIT